MVNLDYLYNSGTAKNVFNQNYFLDKKLGFQVIEHGTILPHKKIPEAVEHKRKVWGAGGIVDSKGEYIKSSHVRSVFGEKYTPPQESIQKSNETVIYLGLFYPVWGHAITDNIRRIWFLKSDFFKKDFKNCPIVYLSWENTTLEHQKNFKRLLEILEVDVDNIRPITKPTQFDKIILPDESFESGFTKEYRETIDRVRNFAIKNRTPTSSKKIYYFYGRNQIGEERLAEYFKSKGYEIIRPEKLPLDEQLNLLINAESFASTLGSCAHNSVFLRDGTEVILFPRRSGYFAIVQPRIDQVNPLNIYYVDSNLSIFSSATPRANCYIIGKQLKNFFGDKFDGYEEEDYKTFLQYVKQSINNGLAVNQQAMIYYEPIFWDFMAQLKQHEDLIAAYNMPPRWEKFRPSLTYQTHAHKVGWSEWLGEEQISNNIKNKRDLQAIKINFPSHKLYYSVYYNAEEGWSQEVESPDIAGTIGKAKAIMGIKIRLDEAGTKEFDILYRAHKFDGTWTSWAKNGDELFSQGIELNAIQIKLEPHLDNEDNKFDDIWNALSKNSEAIYLNGQKINVIQIELESKT